MSKHLQHAHNLLMAAKAAIEADQREHWDVDGSMAGTLDLLDDAMSEIRGELMFREPEYPLTDRGAA